MPRRGLTVKLDDIEALTPDVIAALPTDRLKELRAEVQTVDWPHEPCEAELERIVDRVRIVFQALHSEHLMRTMRLCGGLPEPYVVIRLSGPPSAG